MARKISTKRPVEIVPPDLKPTLRPLPPSLRVCAAQLDPSPALTQLHHRIRRKRPLPLGHRKHRVKINRSQPLPRLHRKRG
jgi:hypothetical protein